LFWIFQASDSKRMKWVLEPTLLFRSQNLISIRIGEKA
jgi:hypothetical protein